MSSQRVLNPAGMHNLVFDGWKDRSELVFPSEDGALLDEANVRHVFYDPRERPDAPDSLS